ncbi:MAG: inositol monophosphatase family protein [Ectobacillus sp.]
MQQLWNDIENYAKEWIKEAGQMLIASLEEAITIETKTSASDLVTNMDRKIEQFFIERIHNTFPEHYILGEEGYGDEPTSTEGIIWLIDPIDGTMNFIHQKRNFAISVGVYHNGKGRLGLIYDPVHDELYHAKAGEGAFCNGIVIPKLSNGMLHEAVIGVNASWLIENPLLDCIKIANIVRSSRGTRSYGCAALEIIYVATGRLDGYITPRLSPWDFGGGAVIVREAGALITTFDGEPLSPIHKSSVIVAKPGVHEQLLQYVNQQC